jgi:hypothetical protein
LFLHNSFFFLAVFCFVSVGLTPRCVPIMYLSCFDAVNLKEGEVCPAARQRGAEEKIHHAKHNRMGWLVGVAVSTTDSESVDRGSNPRRAC